MLDSIAGFRLLLAGPPLSYSLVKRLLIRLATVAYQAKPSLGDAEPGRAVIVVFGPVGLVLGMRSIAAVFIVDFHGLAKLCSGRMRHKILADGPSPQVF